MDYKNKIKQLYNQDDEAHKAHYIPSQKQHVVGLREFFHEKKKISNKVHKDLFNQIQDMLQKKASKNGRTSNSKT